MFSGPCNAFVCKRLSLHLAVRSFKYLTIFHERWNASSEMELSRQLSPRLIVCGSLQWMRETENKKVGKEGGKYFPRDTF